MSNTAGVLETIGTAYPSRAPGHVLPIRSHTSSKLKHYAYTLYAYFVGATDCSMSSQLCKKYRYETHNVE